MRKNNKKGFTLAELLIVVAIIAVLVAIAIPVFTTQLEKSREGVDLANIRAAYGEVKADALGTKNMVYYKQVTGKQTVARFKYIDTTQLAENLGTTYATELDTLDTSHPIYVSCKSDGTVTIGTAPPTAASGETVENIG